MGMQVEFNWFIVAKNKKDLTKSELESCLILTKEGQRIYPIGEQYTLPVIVEDKCMGLANVKNLILSKEATTVVFEMIQLFEGDNPIADYYTDGYRDYKGRQESLDKGGRKNLTPDFLERLHGGE